MKQKNCPLLYISWNKMQFVIHLYCLYFESCPWHGNRTGTIRKKIITIQANKCTLCAFVGLNCNNWIVMQEMENIKLEKDFKFEIQLVKWKCLVIRIWEGLNLLVWSSWLRTCRELLLELPNMMKGFACTIRTNKIYFSFLIYFNNLYSTCFE